MLAHLGIQMSAVFLPHFSSSKRALFMRTFLDIVWLERFRNERRYPRSTFRDGRNKPIKAFACSSNIIVIHVKRRIPKRCFNLSCVLLSINSLRYTIDIFARYMASPIAKFFYKRLNIKILFTNYSLSRYK